MALVASVALGSEFTIFCHLAIVSVALTAGAAAPAGGLVAGAVTAGFPIIVTGAFGSAFFVSFCGAEAFD